VALGGEVAVPRTVRGPKRHGDLGLLVLAEPVQHRAQRALGIWGELDPPQGVDGVAAEDELLRCSIPDLRGVVFTPVDLYELHPWVAGCGEAPGQALRNLKKEHRVRWEASAKPKDGALLHPEEPPEEGRSRLKDREEAPDVFHGWSETDRGEELEHSSLLPTTEDFSTKKEEDDRENERGDKELAPSFEDGAKRT